MALYNIMATCKHAACNQYLSSGPDCGYTTLDLWTGDDSSGRQQFQARRRGWPWRTCGPASWRPCR